MCVCGGGGGGGGGRVGGGVTQTRNLYTFGKGVVFGYMVIY